MVREAIGCFNDARESGICQAAMTALPCDTASESGGKNTRRDDSRGRWSFHSGNLWPRGQSRKFRLGQLRIGMRGAGLFLVIHIARQKPVNFIYNPFRQVAGNPIKAAAYIP